MQKSPLQRNAPASFKMASVAVLVLLMATALLSGCGPRSTSDVQPQTAEQRNAAIAAIAQQFGASEDIEAARMALAPLNLPNPGQSVLALAEAFIAEGQDIRTTVELVALAKALGPVSRMAEDFLAREGASSGVAAAVAMAPTATPMPTPTDTPVPPTETPTPEPTATPTSTSAPEPTATATATPVAQPQVSSASAINVRGGPGTVYPVVGQLQPGRPVDVLGRNSDRTWWQVRLGNGSEGWVAASVVDVTGPVDGIAVAANIPTAPPQPTPRPQPTAAPAVPTSAPAPSQPSIPPGMQYAVASVRVRPLGQDAQQCGGGEHNIFALVTDQAGNPIDGVRVREVFTGNIRVSGEKGPGRVDFDIYMDGGGQLQIVDGDNNPLSAQTIGMPANLPPWDLFLAAGYCNCKPYPDTESCRAGWEARDFRYMPNTHYVYEVVFQRSN
jgi:hypothetical protein